MLGKPLLQIDRDVPGIMDYPLAVAEDWDHVLAAQPPDRLDIGEANEAELDRHALMRERIKDAPRKRAWPPAFVTEALIHDQAHDASPFRPAPMRACAP